MLLFLLFRITIYFVFLKNVFQISNFEIVFEIKKKKSKNKIIFSFVIIILFAFGVKNKLKLKY